MADEKCNDCKSSVLMIELVKRVDKIESSVNEKFEKVDNKFEKIDEKMDVIIKETSANISSLREGHVETRTMLKQALEMISDLKSMLKNNNESNLGLIMQMMKTNSDAIVMNNKTNLEANKVNLEANKVTAGIEKDIKQDKNKTRVEITKGKLAFFGTIIVAIFSIITIVVEKLLTLIGN